MLRLIDTSSCREIMNYPMDLNLGVRFKISPNHKFLAIIYKNLLTVIDIHCGQKIWDRSIIVEKYSRTGQDTFSLSHVENDGQQVQFVGRATPEILNVSKDSLYYQLVLPQGEYIFCKNEQEYSFSANAQSYICWQKNGFVYKTDGQKIPENISTDNENWLEKNRYFRYFKSKESMEEEIARDIAKIKWKKSIAEAMLCRKEKNFMGAFVHYKTAIEQGNSEPETYHCAGHMALLIGNTKQAFKYLRKATSKYKAYLQNMPRHYREFWGTACLKNILFWLASSYALLEEKDAALQYLQKSIEECSDNAQRFFEEEDFEKYRCDKDFLELTAVNES